MKNVADEVLINTYLKTGSIWKTAEQLCLVGQTVYSRLNRLGVVKHINYWSEKDDAVLKEKYCLYKHNGRLDQLAAELGRTKQFICRKAKSLGLTNKHDAKMSEETRNIIGEKTKKWIKENGHPKGMMGHSHSAETKSVISESSIKKWKDPNSYLNSEENKQRLSDLLHYRKMNGIINSFSIRGDHPITIGGRHFIFKSTWEVDIALRLQKLKDDGSIIAWDYETKHFNFDDIKRGTRSYCPDFEVKKLSGEFLYIEVKGWKMERAMNRINMFLERYPNVNLYLIDEKEYHRVISESDYLRRRCV